MRAVGVLPLFLFVGCAGVGPPPLPSDTWIIPPAPTVSRDHAAFSGSWVGTFETADHREIDHVLVIEEVEEDEAAVIVAVGTKVAVFGLRPTWFRHRGTFADGGLKLLHGNASVVYRLQPDGTLTADLDMGGVAFQATMTRLREWPHPRARPAGAVHPLASSSDASAGPPRWPAGVTAP